MPSALTCTSVQLTSNSTMSAATLNSSPIFPYSPNSYSHLLEPKGGSQCVPGTPPLQETIKTGKLSLQRSLNGANLSPMEQLVPEFVSVHRSGGQGARNAVYSGSPLLKQILICGRKRQREDSAEGSSPSPIAVSSKRFCQEECKVPNSLVVIKRSHTAPKHTARGKDELQVVPESPKTEATTSDSKPELAKTQGICTSSAQEEDRSESNSGFKWFDLFLGDSIQLQPEE